jgi:hypothetical protein
LVEVAKSARAKAAEGHAAAQKAAA